MALDDELRQTKSNKLGCWFFAGVMIIAAGVGVIAWAIVMLVILLTRVAL